MRSKPKILTMTTKTQNLVESVQVGRGDKVLARVASGGWVERRVWGVSDAVVYLCSERLYADLLIGASRLWPIGFPKTDIRSINAASPL
jgi:hypothetical protein